MIQYSNFYFYVAPDAYFVVGTAGSGPKERIDAGDEASMKILCPTGGVHQYTEKKNARPSQMHCNGRIYLVPSQNIVYYRVAK